MYVHVEPRCALRVSDEPFYDMIPYLFLSLPLAVPTVVDCLCPFHSVIGKVSALSQARSCALARAIITGQ